jgi:integrase
MKAFLLVLATSGMRLGEAVTLRLKDIDFGTNPVRIVIPAAHTKNFKERETYVTKEAADALQRFKAEAESAIVYLEGYHLVGKVRFHFFKKGRSPGGERRRYVEARVQTDSLLFSQGPPPTLSSIKWSSSEVHKKSR